MAERRMVSKQIVDSDSFLDAPLSTQALYLHLLFRADDDGFVHNPRKIQRMIGASDDDLKLLISKNFLIVFETGVVVIKHWRIHNYIQKDRYKPTVYQEEKNLLELKQNGAYTIAEKLPSVPMDTECIQTGYSMDTQDRLELGKSKVNIYNYTRGRFGDDKAVNAEFAEYVKFRKQIKKPMTDHAMALAISKLDQLSGGNPKLAVEILRQSIREGWSGLYEIKGNKKTEGNNKFHNFEERKTDLDADIMDNFNKIMENI